MKRKVYAALTFAMGALALYMAFYVSSEIRTKKDWPTTQGKVLERGTGATVGTRATSVRARVKYQYTVDGKQYVNEQVHLIATTGGDIRDMQALADSLPDPVTVHYNPSDPSQAYLIKNSMTFFWILLPIGILLSLIAIVMLLGGKKG